MTANHTGRQEDSNRYWGVWYIAVLAGLAAQVAFYYFLTQYYK